MQRMAYVRRKRNEGRNREAMVRNWENKVAERPQNDEAREFSWTRKDM
jgi:hypothetical protein